MHRTAHNRLLRRKVDRILHAPMLSDTRQRRLMVRRRIDAKHPVHPRGQTTRQIGTQRTIRIQRGVQALEERKRRRVKRIRVVQVPQRFNHNVRVPDQHPVPVHLRRCRIVVLLCVRERARLEVLQLQLRRERLVGRHRAKVQREHELRGRNLVLRDDVPHRHRVARPLALLLAIGELHTKKGKCISMEVEAHPGGRGSHF